MANEQDMSNWTDLLHSSTKLLEQAAPSPQFPPLQVFSLSRTLLLTRWQFSKADDRNLDQLEALSKKLKAKTIRTEAPSQSIAATRLLAREGINTEQLARDLKSFELKTTFEDVFPAEATSVEEYLQQVHEMAMVSAIQEAQKDNVRSFNDYMMRVLEVSAIQHVFELLVDILQEDWQKERRDFLQSLSRISSSPWTKIVDSSTGRTHPGQLASLAYSPHASSGPSGMEIVPLANKSIVEKKAPACSEVVKNLNRAREHGSQFKPATAFKSAYESLGVEVSGGKSVNMQKIWHLVQTLVGENTTIQPSGSRKLSLAIGARHHLEWGHEKYIMDTIQNHPAQAALGGAVGNLQRVRAFLRIRLRDYGVLDFDAGDTHRQPPVDTTWQQIYFCLRTGYYEEARTVALSSRASHQFAPMLMEWINSGGMVPVDIAAAASEEWEKMLRMGDRVGRAAYDKKKLLLYALVSGSRRQIDRMLRDLPTLFNTIEDFMWFKLSVVREYHAGTSSQVLNENLVPYSLEDLQAYLNKFEPSYYTKNGKDPLVYPYVLLLSIQMLPAILYLSKEAADEGYNIDAVHVSITLADHGVLAEGTGAGQTLGVMDAYAEVSSIIRQYGSAYLRHGNLSMALEYYAQAAATVGGGETSWTGRGNIDQQRQRNVMLTQLLTELLLRDGGIHLLLGPRGAGEEGELARFLTDSKARHQFLLEAARKCQEAGLDEKSIEIQKRVGAFSMALDTINKCLSEAICALSRGGLDGEIRSAGLINSGNEILETFKYYPNESFPELNHLVMVPSFQERDHVLEQETVLRQLEAILSVHKLARASHYLDALRELAKLPFLPLGPRVPDVIVDTLQNLSPHVQACVPDLLKVALTCLDNVTDSDGTLRAMRAKIIWTARNDDENDTDIAQFLANNMNRNWPRDLYEKVSRSL
ncbi:hypothetical protein DKX38_021939 [Salix brachista]|uniref:Nuclear pore protein n=1 Tax=Salix brachista TaxID=2182728 RepID=A0A5N5K3D3_9ROSI|nr:hypothetical protein DKX38_021939 [Salix brachista]